MDAAADKFSSAEDALFGAKAKPATVEAADASAPSTASSMGRILRDLHEPSPPPPPEPPAPARRGRKPGSKNKPKPVLAAAPVASASRPARPAWADAVAAKYTSADAIAMPGSPAPSVSPVREPARSASVADGTSQSRRTRLRDRSSILKRYVLGTEPAPGQAGWVRGLRSKRQR